MRQEQKTDQSRELRKTLTPAEKALWNKIRDHRLNDRKFRRQHPVGPYIVDFCCAELSLIIELDGDVHAFHEAGDARRQAYFLEAWFSGNALSEFGGAVQPPVRNGCVVGNDEAGSGFALTLALSRNGAGEGIPARVTCRGDRCVDAGGQSVDGRDRGSHSQDHPPAKDHPVRKLGKRRCEA